MTIYQEQGGIRSLPISQKLQTLFTNAAADAGVDVHVFSGGQHAKGSVNPSTGKSYPHTGSTRHDEGNAGDIYLTVNGRKLREDNPADLPIIQTFIQSAVKNGATGIGAGAGYMGVGNLHVGFGRSELKNAGLTLWGPGETSKTTPAWLKQAASGVQRLPPADIPNPPPTSTELIAGRGAPGAALGYTDTGGPPGGPPTLRKGATDAKTGGAVTRLQQQLAAVPGGPPVAIDGKYGKQTEKAVRAVEKQYNLPTRDRGVAGPQVQAALAGNQRLRDVQDTQARFGVPDGAFGAPLAPGGVPSIPGAPPPMGIGRNSPAVSPVPVAQNPSLTMPRPQGPLVTAPPDPNAPPLVPPPQAVTAPHSLGPYITGAPGRTGLPAGQVPASKGYAEPKSVPPVYQPSDQPVSQDNGWTTAPVQDITSSGVPTQTDTGANLPGKTPSQADDFIARVTAGITGGRYTPGDAAYGITPPGVPAWARGVTGAPPSTPPVAGVGTGGINTVGDLIPSGAVGDWLRQQLGGGPPSATAMPPPGGYVPAAVQPDNQGPERVGGSRAYGRMPGFSGMRQSQNIEDRRLRDAAGNIINPDAGLAPGVYRSYDAAGNIVPNDYIARGGHYLPGDNPDADALQRIQTQILGRNQGPELESNWTGGPPQQSSLGGYPQYAGLTGSPGTLGRSAPPTEQPYQEFVVPDYGYRNFSAWPAPQVYPPRSGEGGFNPDPLGGEHIARGWPSQQAGFDAPASMPSGAGLGSGMRGTTTDSIRSIPQDPSRSEDLFGTLPVQYETTPAQRPVMVASGGPFTGTPTAAGGYTGGAPAFNPPVNGQAAAGGPAMGYGPSPSAYTGGAPVFNPPPTPPAPQVASAVTIDRSGGGFPASDLSQFAPASDSAVDPFSASGLYGVNADSSRLDPGTLDTAGAAAGAAPSALGGATDQAAAAPGGVPYATDPMARTTGFTNIGNGVVQTPVPRPTLGARIARTAVPVAASMVPGIGPFLGLIANSAMRTGSFDNAQPYRGATGGNYATVMTSGGVPALTPYGTQQYNTGSSISNSPFTPSGSGWVAPSFDPVSGGASYAYNPMTHTYVDSQGRTHSYD